MKNTSQFNRIFKASILGFVILFCTQCQSTAEEDTQTQNQNQLTSVTEQTEATVQVQTAIETALDTIDSIDTESFELSEKTLDCYTSGNLTTYPEENTLSFNECNTTINDYSLLINGDITLTGNLEEQSATLTTDIEASLETATDSYSFAQTGSIAVAFTETTASVTFSDLEGSASQNEESVTYFLDGDLSYNTETGTITGDVTIETDDLNASCTFDDFDPATAETLDWLQACDFE